MTKAIYCDCGLVCRGESDEELLREAERHLRDDHPALSGTVAPADLLAMAVEVPSETAASDPDPSEGPVVVRRTGRTATVVLNRPERRNALSLDMLHRLRGVLADIAADAGVRAVVVAGAGPAFCSGHDLHEMRGRDEQYYRELFTADGELMRALHALPQPVVARVHGAATAGGCHLVAACDLAVASPDASFAVPGPAMGLVGTTAMVEVARLVGRRRALQMLLTGAAITAETALAWGLVNAVAPRDELDAAAHAMARAASAGGPATADLAKRALYENLDLPLPAAYAHAERATWQSLPGPEAQEGIGAFLDKRRADWEAG